jgi:hypothetical protein
LIIDKIREVQKMNLKEIIITAKSLVIDGKGLMAIDESNPTWTRTNDPLIMSQVLGR